MFDKIKGFIQAHKAKAAVAASTVLAVPALTSVTAFAADDNLEAGIITNPVQTVDLWTTLTGGVSTFFNGILVPVASFCTTNGICLMFLTVTFIKLGVGVLKKTISAFGRGR